MRREEERGFGAPLLLSFRGENTSERYELLFLKELQSLFVLQK